MKYATCHPTKRHEARGMCRHCYRAWYSKTFREEAAESQRKWRKKNPDKVAEYVKRRDYQTSIYRYGLNADEARVLLKKFGDHCPICKRKPHDNHKRLSVDHDHKTGRVRGLLCNSCNLAIGKFKDNPIWLRKAADYLEGRLFTA